MNALPPARARHRPSTARTFAVPSAIAVTSVAGLIVGLTGDGVTDILCWALLAPPLVATAWAWRDRR